MTAGARARLRQSSELYLINACTCVMSVALLHVSVSFLRDLLYCNKSAEHVSVADPFQNTH
jgi:hypothetical protein